MEKYFSNGFTLIEVLVAVLIAVVLVTIAIPQYQKSVERTRAKQAIAMLKQVYTSAEFYYLQHGSWPTDLSQIDFKVPWTGTTRWYTYSAYSKSARSNADWSVQFYNNASTSKPQWAVFVGRISGPWAGSGFSIWREDKESKSKQPLHTILCMERTSSGVVFSTKYKEGDYCQKILGATPIATAASSVRSYLMKL